MEYPSPIEVGLRNQSFSLRGDLSATFGLGWLLLLVAGMAVVSVVVMSSFNNEGEGGGSAATAAIAGSFYSSALCFK